MKSTLRTLHVLATLAFAACSPEGGEPAPDTPSVAESEDSAAAFQGRIYERNLVFLTPQQDSTLVVPWLFSARTRAGTVDRRARGWLHRSGAWEPFFGEEWETPPTRAPWRILPRENMRILVGLEDALDRIVFSEGPRQLEVVLDGSLVEWSGPRGGTFRLLDGGLVLANQRVEGLILDMSRARRAEDAPPGDWAILVSGDSLQAVLHAPRALDPGSSGAYRAWARLDFRQLQWPSVTVEWSETRAFERARRDVPYAWTLASDDADLGGTLRVRAAEIDAGAGEGPQLPVAALFEVTGTLRIEEASYPVHGILRHEQR